ncbi:cytochrome c oxidase assembly factor 3 homolog, mitochondrial [Carcharodon carcharias]|uniref:cytochrome c oxidase assembly factor 3 homolog, mitochondrial n=1 Tax=Carcharodon carcharias TaxID=13397 RepID=UPI001B7EBCF7|nr:cytochrome c oxidase assembly factor 3 homolog, mitochondrial [Carcharodon carcharias]
MAEMNSKGGSEFAKRVDPKKDNLSKEQIEFMRKVELAQWHKNLQKRRGRNLITGLAIGAIVLGIYGYTFYSVSQERFFDDLEKEAKSIQTRSDSKTSVN